MDRIQLSENFYLDEFTRSQTAARMGREIVPTEQEIENLRRLCGFVLQPVRDALGAVHVSSGLRPAWLNKIIGGADTSQHVYALAADFTVSGHSPLQVCRFIEEGPYPFDQLIHEFGKWTHVSVAGEQGAALGSERRQSLTALHVAGHGTEYRPGLLEV